jgi:hypothetical protein
MIQANKEALLKNSDTFCIFPWLHFMVTPPGDVYPCCASVSAPALGQIDSESTFDTLVNNDNFKQLRKDMIDGIKNETCQLCYDFERYGHSWRHWGNENFGHRIDEVINNTEEDGTVNNFKMRYYDIRFNNICNFKCRTCGPDYSTLWAQEEGLKDKIYNLTKTTKVLDEFLSHIDDVEFVYFAGGEPMITEDHYIILEELIRKGKTDIKLRYNTNCSVLNYKDKSVLDLWKNFKHIEVGASIDHIKDRAEYIRHGTDWGVIETNLKKFQQLDNVELMVNTVLSVFNYVTLADVYGYLIKNNILKTDSWHFSLITTPTPAYFAATTLPTEFKDLGRLNNTNLVNQMSGLGYTSQLNLINSAIQFTDSVDNWDQHGPEFIQQILRKDDARGESFKKTFPELASMLDWKSKTIWIKTS